MSDNKGGDAALDAARRRSSRLGLGGAFFATGAAGLIFELSWLRLFVNVFGHTTYSTGAVLAAFMGGMGLGGLIFGRMADRSERPLRLFGKLAAGAGAAGMAVPLVTWALVPLYRAVFRAAPDSIWLLVSTASPTVSTRPSFSGRRIA